MYKALWIIISAIKDIFLDMYHYEMEQIDGFYRQYR